MSKGADYREVGRFGVIVHVDPGAMPSDDWVRILRAQEEHGARLRFLVVWADGSLSATQRAESQKLQLTMGFLTLLFTDSPVSRGVGKVLQWFGVKLRVHPKASLVMALETEGATRDEIGAVRHAIRDLEAELRVDSLRSHRTDELIAPKKSSMKR